VPDFDHPFLQTSNLFVDDACLVALSKDLAGALYERDRSVLFCPDGSCKSLRQRATLSLYTRSHDPCDKLRRINGKMYWQITNAHVDGDPLSRAVHMGAFRWASRTFVIGGQVRGFTHESVVHPPAFEGGRCDQKWIMEGQLLGRVLRGEPRGTSVVANYRIILDDRATTRGRPARGTLEGIAWHDCPVPDGDGKIVCVEFEDMSVGSGPNPRTEKGAKFTIFDHAGAMTGSSEIVSWGGHTGLHCDYKTTIELPAPCNLVKATLVHFNPAGAKVIALNSGGGVVDSAALPSTQGVEHGVSLGGAGIVRVEIEAPQDETLLLAICWQPQ
jgi:hypothetical protein